MVRPDGTMRPDDEIRKIPINARCELAAKLEVNEDWKTLMGIIPKSYTDSGNKYDSEHVRFVCSCWLQSIIEASYSFYSALSKKRHVAGRNQLLIF